MDSKDSKDLEITTAYLITNRTEIKKLGIYYITHTYEDYINYLPNVRGFIIHTTDLTTMLPYSLLYLCISIRKVSQKINMIDKLPISLQMISYDNIKYHSNLILNLPPFITYLYIYNIPKKSIPPIPFILNMMLRKFICIITNDTDYVKNASKCKCFEFKHLIMTTG